MDELFILTRPRRDMRQLRRESAAQILRRQNPRDDPESRAPRLASAAHEVASRGRGARSAAARRHPAAKPSRTRKNPRRICRMPAIAPGQKNQRTHREPRDATAAPML
jgi:hypothetical protein